MLTTRVAARDGGAGGTFGTRGLPLRPCRPGGNPQEGLDRSQRGPLPQLCKPPLPRIPRLLGQEQELEGKKEPVV